MEIDLEIIRRQFNENEEEENEEEEEDEEEEDIEEEDEEELDIKRKYLKILKKICSKAKKYPPMTIKEVCKFLNLDIQENSSQIIIDEVLEKNKDKLKNIKRKLKNLKFINLICLCNDDNQKEFIAKYFTTILPNINYKFTCDFDDFINFLDMCSLDETNSILISLEKFSMKVYKEIKKYISKTIRVSIYHAKFSKFIDYKKLNISTLNNIFFLIFSLYGGYKEVHIHFKYPKQHLSDNSNKGQIILDLKRNMNYKINLNNTSQNYLEYKDKMDLYESLKNITFLILFET